MKINWAWPGWVWVEHTLEMCMVTAAATMWSVWQSAPQHDLGSIHWEHAFSQAGYAALGALLLSVVSLKIPNGTASLNPNVVAKKKPAETESPK